MNNCLQKKRFSIISPLPLADIKDKEIYKELKNDNVYHANKIQFWGIADKIHIPWKTVYKIFIALLLAVFLCVAAQFVQTGYDVYVDGKYIGVSKGYIKADVTPFYYLKIVSEDDLTPEANLKKNIELIVDKPVMPTTINHQIELSHKNDEVAQEVISQDDFLGTGCFIAPVQAPVTSYFGSRWGRVHEGTDFGATEGTAIVAADNGIVSFSGWQDGYGNFVIIDHQNGFETCYAHCSELYVTQGCNIRSGDVIASVGNTGNSTGPHLHFEVRYNGNPVDALSYIQ